MAFYKNQFVSRDYAGYFSRNGDRLDNHVGNASEMARRAVNSANSVAVMNGTYKQQLLINGIFDTEFDAKVKEQQNQINLAINARVGRICCLNYNIHPAEYTLGKVLANSTTAGEIKKKKRNGPKPGVKRNARSKKEIPENEDGSDDGYESNGEK